MNLNEKITHYRKINELNKSQFAKKLNVSPAYITMIENGKKVPSNELLLKIASLFNISPTELDKDFPIESFKSALEIPSISFSKEIQKSDENSTDVEESLLALEYCLKSLPGFDKNNLKSFHKLLFQYFKKSEEEIFLKNNLQLKDNDGALVNLDEKALNMLAEKFLKYALENNMLKFEIDPDSPRTLIVEHVDPSNDVE